MQAELDATDWHSLHALRTDATLPATDVATKVNVTSTTCWRRITRLKNEGVIKKRVSILDRAAVGLSLMIIAHVKLWTQGRNALMKFDQAIRRHPEVLECYTLMRDWDFLLRNVAKDIRACETFFLDNLSKTPHVQAIHSPMVLTRLRRAFAPCHSARNRSLPRSCRL